MVPAPPVYRPQQPVTVQRSSAPPVYRPQSPVLPQRQTTAPLPTLLVQRATKKKPAPPPVYRPQSAPPQGKIAPPLPALQIQRTAAKPPMPPSVYRPNNALPLQPKMEPPAFCSRPIQRTGMTGSTMHVKRAPILHQAMNRPSSIQRMLRDVEMSPYQVDAQSTSVTSWVNSSESTPMTLYGTGTSGDGLHAEDRVISYINTHDVRDKVIVLYLTKSPCTSTRRLTSDGELLPATRTDGTGCTEKLIEIAAGRNLRFQILCRNYYSPSISKADIASVEAVNALLNTGNFAFSIEKEPRSKKGKEIAEKYKASLVFDEDGFVEE